MCIRDRSGGAAGGIWCGSGKGREIWGAVFASVGVRERFVTVSYTHLQLADLVDVVFTATPQGLCASLINEEILSKVKVIDLSADFRIKDVNIYEQWYKICLLYTSLSKAVASQKFYEFRTKLQAKCKENGIELRVVDRWYPSSKTCHCCGAIRKDLKLSDRIFQCDCGYIEDRDFNAALNLRDATTYEIA